MNIDDVPASEVATSAVGDVVAGCSSTTEHDLYHSRSTAVVQDCDLCVLEDQRIFYIHHSTHSSHWEPPWASWRCRLGLPYGWEQARDDAGNHYFIDHINRRTTYNDPRQSKAPEGERHVTVSKRPEIGYGFVAAGQQPTVIQFVSPEGPSDGLLYANDQILRVNGVDVRNETKETVVNLVRAAEDKVELTVEQLPQRPRSARKNFKVRFTERVLVSSAPDSPTNELPPPLPNVIRVYLENGQTRSFRYDSTTTVRDVEQSLLEKLQIVKPCHFCLSVEYSLGARSSRISLLQPHTTIQKLISMPNSEHLRCVLRVAFVPTDCHALLLEDPKAFEYFYLQCTNDVVRGRFAFEMRYEACMRLAALQMQQVALDSKIFKDGRVSVSRLEKEYGLETFLPSILLENVKKREIRKHLHFYIKRDSAKMNDNGSSNGTKKAADEILPMDTWSLPSCEQRTLVRLKYLHVISHLPSFGGRGFSVTFKESLIEMIMQVDPRCGLLVRHPGKSGQPTISIGYDLIASLLLKKESEVASLISIQLANNLSQGLEFLVDIDDVDDLVMFIRGYHAVHVGAELECTIEESSPAKKRASDEPPPYSGCHMVTPTGWNYAEEATKELKLFDLSEDPPSYELANSFAEMVIDTNPSEEEPSTIPVVEVVEQPKKEAKETEKKKDLPRSPPPSRRNSDAAKKLLKATDSLLIRNSRELHLKEILSPILRRPSNPSGRKMDVLSDSSDTEDSSWSSPMRSPLLKRDEDKLDPPTIDLLAPENNCVRRESIETLIQTVNIDKTTNLESLILLFPDGKCDDLLLTPQNDEQRHLGNGKLSNGAAKNANRRCSLVKCEGAVLIDNVSAILNGAPIAAIDDECGVSDL